MKAILTFIAGLIINCLVGIIGAIIGSAIFMVAAEEVVCPKSDFDSEEECRVNRADFAQTCVRKVFGK